MQSDFRVKKLVTEEGGDVVAICYDVLYGETFEKYIGIPDDFDARENASNLLQDSNYEISDEIRTEIEETFGITEFDDDQDYDSYQFYDFGDDEWEDDKDEIDELVYAGNGNGISTEDEDEFSVPTRLLKKESFNLREALNTIDLNTYNKYDLLNLYESCDLSENEKRALANIVYDQEDAEVIYDTLNNRYVKGEEIGMPERVKDGVIHEDDMREGFTYIDTGTNVEVYSDYYIAKSRANKLGLKLAEYGDLDDKYSYCYWNESGNRNDDEQVLAYYKFVDTVPAPLDEFERQLMIDRYEKGPFDNEINESKSIKEDFYRGNKSVQFIGHGEWNDPELEYKGYLFNYWDIEDALWNDFLEETGYSDAQSDDPTVESQFNKFVQDRASDLLDDCIYGGSFTGLSVEGEIMDFPNDDYYYVGYDYKTQELSLDNAYNTGRTPEYSIKYDFSKSIDENLQALYDFAIEKSPWLSGDEDLDESVDEFEFDDEFNAYYDGYTEEDKDKNSAFNKLKDNQINESDVNDYDFVGLNAELRKVMSPDEIDNHSSDLYVKKTAKSTEVLKRFNILGHPLCTTFIDNITHTPWYEVAFGYVPQEVIKESIDEEPYTKEMVEQDLKSITKNFTEKEGELKCGFKEEKDFGVEILKQHYKIVEVSGDDRREGTWYHISFAEPKNLNDEPIKITSNSKMKEIEIEDKSEVGADGHPIDRLSNYSSGKLK